MTKNKKPFIYLAGDIMSHGSNLARQEEYNKFISEGIDADVYSPVLNKSINDKSAMTEEQNNHLAEKITAEDIGRLWESDAVVISPEQSAVGTLCELGCLYGWYYVGLILDRIIGGVANELGDGEFTEEKQCEFEKKLTPLIIALYSKLTDKAVFAHYFDIRTNHLNEKDWRRSFSINQLLYGMILGCTNDHELNNSFDEALEKLKNWVEEFNSKDQENE